MFNYGISLWGFMPMLRSGRMTVEEALQKISALGVTGLEVLPNLGHIGPYPEYTADDVARWKDLMERYHLIPVCNSAMIICISKLACGAQMASMPNLHLDASREDMLGYMRHEIKLTSDFGFSRMRHPLMTGIPMDVIEETLPYAEDLGIALDLEVHSPYKLDGPEVEAQLNMIEKHNSKISGIIPDFNIFVDRVAPCFRAQKISEGAESELIAELDAALAAHEVMKPVCERIYAATENPATRSYADYVAGLAPNELEDLKPLMKYVHHVHAKSFDFDEDCNETTLDFEKYMRFFHEAGFEGCFMAEYEGFLVHAPGDGSEAETMLTRQLTLQRRIEAALS